MFDRKAYQREYANKKYHALSIEEKRTRNSSQGFKAAKVKYRANPTNRAKENASCREWYKRNKLRKRINSRLCRYSLSQVEYDFMFQSQNGLCAVCKEPPILKSNYSSLDGFAIDHDHKTGKVRGLLCESCNKGIGCLKDSPEKCELAANYLRRTKDANV